MQNNVHEVPEHRWCPVSAKGEDPVLPVTGRGREDGFELCFWHQGYLPVSICQVEGQDKAGPPQAANQLIHSGQRVAFEV